MRPPALVLLFVACAHPLSTGPHDAAYLPERGPACPASDQTCCDAASARVREAAARGDARTADEEAERLALSCPTQRRGLLADVLRAPRRSPDETATVEYKWRVVLPAEDRIFWAAAYLDGSRRSSVVPGQHELVVEVHVLAGAEPGRGERYQLRHEQPVQLGQGLTRTSITIARTDGPEPFRLDIGVPQSVTMVGGLGVLKMNPGSRLVPLDAPRRPAAGAAAPTPAPAPEPAFEGPPRRPAPDFRPPSEWLDGGVGRQVVQSCADKQGRRLSVGMQGSSPPLHPRLMGATIDWLRRFEYDAAPDKTFIEYCENVHPRFDRPVVPPSVQGQWPKD